MLCSTILYVVAGLVFESSRENYWTHPEYLYNNGEMRLVQMSVKYRNLRSTCFVVSICPEWQGPLGIYWFIDHCFSSTSLQLSHSWFLSFIPCLRHFFSIYWFFSTTSHAIQTAPVTVCPYLTHRLPNIKVLPLWHVAIVSLTQTQTEISTGDLAVSIQLKDLWNGTPCHCPSCSGLTRKVAWENGKNKMAVLRLSVEIIVVGCYELWTYWSLLNFS